MAWAVPLSDDEFEIKEISNKESICRAIRLFCKKINVLTKINIEYKEELWNG